jgi:hypothetical protein
MYYLHVSILLYTAAQLLLAMGIEALLLLYTDPVLLTYWANTVVAFSHALAISSSLHKLALQPNNSIYIHIYYTIANNLLLLLHLNLVEIASCVGLPATPTYILLPLLLKSSHLSWPSLI